MEIRSQQGHFFLFFTVIPVATSKACHDRSSQQFLFNSASFSGRNLESVSQLSGGPSYLVLVTVAQT